MGAGKISQTVHSRIFNEMMAITPATMVTSELLRVFAVHLTHGRSIMSGLTADERVEFEAKRKEINAEVDKRIPLPPA